MFKAILLLFNILSLIIPQGEKIFNERKNDEYFNSLKGQSLVCYMCDSIGETNCFGATCVGSACIKRSALIDGILRVQKMCQQISEPLLEYCETGVLWKGGVGAECICQTDYCNNTGKAFQNIAFALLPFITLHLSQQF